MDAQWRKGKQQVQLHHDRLGKAVIAERSEPVGAGTVVPCSSFNSQKDSSAFSQGCTQPVEQLSKPGNKGRPKSRAEDEMDEAEKKAFYRKRNAMYSRRKYMRKKIEIEVLQTQKAELMNQKQLLKFEEKRLIALLGEARRLVVIHSGTGGRSAIYGAHIGAGALRRTPAPEVQGGRLHPSLPLPARRALLQYQQLKNQGQQPQALQHSGSLPPWSSLPGSLQDQLAQQQLKNQGQHLPTVTSLPGAIQDQVLLHQLTNELAANSTPQRSPFAQALPPNLPQLQQVGLSPLDQRQGGWGMIRDVESNRSTSNSASDILGLFFPHGIP